MKLLPKIVLAVVVPVLLGAGAVLYLLTGSWQRALEAELVEHARRALVARVDTVPEGLLAARDSLRLLARSPVLARGDIEHIRRTLHEWNRQTRVFEGFYFHSVDGRSYPADGNAELLAAPDIEALKRGEELMARPLISRFSQRPVLQMVVPVHGPDGLPVGGLAGTIVLSSFFERTTADWQARDARFLLLDREGRLLAGGLDGNTAMLEEPDVSDAPKTFAIIAAVRSAQLAEEVSTNLRVSVDHGIYRVLHAPVPLVSWRLLFVQPEVSMLSSLAEAQKLAWVVVLVAGLAGLVLAILLYRFIVRPIRFLTRAQTSLQAGDRNVRAPETGSDELSRLGFSFNRMAESLGASEARFKAVFEASPFAVVVNRLSDGQYLDVNPAFERLSGFLRTDIIGKTGMELGLVVNVDEMQAQHAQLLATGRLDSVEAMGVDRNGEPRWTLYSSRVIELEGEAVAISMTVDITHLKAVEAALRDSEAGFTALFQLAPIPMAYTTEHEGYRGTHWNESWYKHFGYSREEAENRGGNDIGLWVNPEDRTRFVQLALVAGAVSDFEVDLRRRDGSVRQCNLYCQFIYSGGQQLLMTVYLDMTDSRRAETELRDRETRLRSLFEVSPAGIFVLDYMGRISMCNQRFADMLGHPVDYLLQRDYLEVVHPIHREEARNGIGKMLVDPAREVFAAERAYLGRNGEMLWGLLSARRLPPVEGNEDVLLATVNDISALRKAEAERRESDIKLQAIFNASPTAMIVSDAARNYASVAANDAWERQFMRRRDEVMGQSGAEMGLWASNEDRQKVLAAITQFGFVDGFETELVRGDGVRLRCRVSARKVLAGDAELLVMVQEDVTDLLRAEASLQALNQTLTQQFSLADAVARAQSNFIANAEATGAFESLLADLLQLAESEYGFIGEVLHDEGGAPYLRTHAITNIAWDASTREFYEKNVSGGLEFHNLKTLFGAAMVTGEPVIANAPAIDARRGGLPPGHPAMTAFLGLPIRVAGQLVAMAGVANRQGGYDQALVDWLQPMLGTIGQMVEARRAALARQAAEKALRELNDELDERVQERTQALNLINDELSGTLETLRRAQGELVRSEKLAALGSLVAGVAHELNTPIGNSVTVASTLVENSEAFAEEMQGGLKRSVLQAYVENSRRAAELLLGNLQRAANLVSSFKQVAVDQTSEQRRHFYVAEVVDEILAMLRPQLKKQPVVVRTEIAHGLVLDSYPGPFGQVVANLVNNAAIHAFDDGRKLGVIMIEARACPGGVHLCVSDDGVGIPPDNIDRIFDPFFTTRFGQGGSGLGLNIVYNIVTRMLGGKVHVESRPGEGSSFIVQLPEVAPARETD